MKFNESWLREWVNPALSRSELAEQITLAGLEVDSIDAVAGEFSGVVVGKVITCQQHPNADKLRVTKVDVGAPELLSIVCGAPNCREGLLVACATVGAVLPGDFKIKAAKLRGEPSEGMLCSYSELGIDIDSSGIIELPLNAPIGMDVREYLQFDDVTIEVGLTPNRADCLSIRGVARDVAVLNGLAFNELDIPQAKETIADKLSVDVKSPEDCPRYLTRVIKGIDVKAQTPLIITERLRRCGVRSIDAVVDITNYILLELGQPMHAFDLNKIHQGIIVRKANKDEKLILLDGSEVSLTDDTLIIADHEKPLAMAGVFGGQYSGVNEQTQDILLESAFFSPLAIVGKARSYGLHTDSSHRFERGVDPLLTNKAMERATTLILDICGGQAGPIVEVTSEQYLPHTNQITLRRSKLDKLLGYVVDDEKVTQILKNLGCKVNFESNQWVVNTPSWRFDMAIEEDLVEEVARIYGYNNIPFMPIETALVMTAKEEKELPLQRVKTLLVDKGYFEAITYSFVDPKVQELLHPEQKALVLPNPISVEMSAMRISLWSGLIDAVLYNQNRQQNRARLFETGLRFIPDSTENLGVKQEMMIAGIITGQQYPDHWQLPSQSVDYYDLKGDVEAILDLTGKQELVSFKPCENAALHPGQSAAIYLEDQLIGFIGVIHPQIENILGLNGRTVVFEIQWDKIKERRVPIAEEISRFPANRRDISIIVAEDISAENIINECKRVGGNQLVGVNLFDVYRGKGVSDGYKSLAIALTLQDKSRTLEEIEIAKVVNTCVEALEVRFQALLRD